MIVVTGAAGFIGSCLVGRLSEEGYSEIVAVDDFGRLDKNYNLVGKSISKMVHRNDFRLWLGEHGSEVQAIFHIGARTDTTELDVKLFDELNLHYSMHLWDLSCKFQIPFFYASSAATYGSGENGYSDEHAGIINLRPLNPYGQSKQDFDEWVLSRVETPPVWFGFKFFNVYGPNEYHKSRMASVVFHAFHQIRKSGGMKLFRSHRPDIADGYQSRDFIYIRDVLDVLLYFYRKMPKNGIYNLGTGKARTFLDLTHSVFQAAAWEEKISFIDTPEDIRDTYQYFTEADTGKLRSTGFEADFTKLEDGISEYVRNYLMSGQYY